MKKTVSVVLAFLLAVLCLLPVGAMTDEEWNRYWKENEEIEYAVHVSPGNRESERYFTWYGKSEDCSVLLSRNEDMAGATEIKGKGTLNPQGDYTERVFVDGLKDGIYYYKCVSEGFTSSVASVSVNDGSFSAMYVTDVHMTRNAETENEEMILNANQFHTILEKSREKGAELVLSAGDQATNGERIEYTAFTSSPVIKGMTVATCVGNHDKKDIDYRYYASYTMTDYCGVKEYVSRDYWFTKGDVLFMVLNTNAPDSMAHRAFMKSAVKANPDAKWRVCIFHHDLFGGRIESRESENRNLRLIHVPMMDEFKIDLVLAGHSHYYTQSDVLYNWKSVEKTDHNCTVEDAKGTIYVVSGSAREGRYVEGGEIPPLGKHVGYDYLTSKAVYNVIDFSEESIVLHSYTLDSDEPFNTLTIKKTTAEGGHPKSLAGIWNAFVRFISAIVAVTTNIDRMSAWKEKNISVPLGEGLFGM